VIGIGALFVSTIFPLILAQCPAKNATEASSGHSAGSHGLRKSYSLASRPDIDDHKKYLINDLPKNLRRADNRRGRKSEQKRNLKFQYLLSLSNTQDQERSSPGQRFVQTIDSEA
jgi:hypothetical protein